MTGFGRGVFRQDGREITAELKSVNHRFLDLSFRMPRSLSFIEDRIRKFLQNEFARGHIDIYISYKNDREDAREAVVDRAVVGAYIEAAKEIGKMGVSGRALAMRDIIRLPDAVRIYEKEDDHEALGEVLLGALGIAAAQMTESRVAEGQRLKEDISARLDFIMKKREKIAIREPLVVADYRDKLKQRIDALLEGIGIDEARLMQEVAVFADKASIAEELMRLGAHIDSMRRTMDEEGAVGRRLDFIVQELNRETNTIGSKASDMEILENVVDIKAEIEKIREQVQNVQ